MKDYFTEGLKGLLKDWKSCVLLLAALFFFLRGEVLYALVFIVAEMFVADLGAKKKK